MRLFLCHDFRPTWKTNIETVFSFFTCICCARIFLWKKYANKQTFDQEKVLTLQSEIIMKSLKNG